MSFSLKHLLLAVLVVVIWPSGVSGEASSREADALASGILREVNEVRRKERRPTLAQDSGLTALAQEWSDHLIASGTFSHRPDLLDRVRELNMTTITENVWQASNIQPADRIVGAWMDSPRHAKNVLSMTSTLAGVGVSRASDGRTVVVFQGGSR